MLSVWKVMLGPECQRKDETSSHILYIYAILIKSKRRLWELIGTQFYVMSIIVSSIIILCKAFLLGLLVSLLVPFIVKRFVRIKFFPVIVICVVFFLLYLFQFTLWFSASKAEKYVEKFSIVSTSASIDVAEIFVNTPWLKQILSEDLTNIDIVSISEIQSLQKEIDSYKNRRILWFTIFFIGEILLCFLVRENQARNFVQPTYNNDYTQRKVKF